MPLPEFTLERYFARWEFAAPYLLCSSDIEGWRMDDLLALADDECRDLWLSLRLGYTEYAGLPLLRKEAAHIYNRISADQILMASGAEECAYLCLQQLVGPGDHAIVTWPGYQSLEELPRAAGAEVSRWELREEDAWLPDVARLRSLLRPNTRLILVNFPHNPTGALPDRKTWSEIIAVAQDAEAWLFSDEVYRESEHDAAHRLPAAVDLYERAISLGVMSKTYALAGLRIGWLASHDEDLLRRTGSQKDYTTIGNSAPGEILALIGLRARDRLIARSLDIIQRNLPLLDRFFEEWQTLFSWARPRAGAIAFPRWKSATPIAQIASQLVERQGVLILPATVYGYPGNHFRLGFGRNNMPEALARMEQFLRESVSR